MHFKFVVCFADAFPFCSKPQHRVPESRAGDMREMGQGGTVEPGPALGQGGCL